MEVARREERGAKMDGTKSFGKSDCPSAGSLQDVGREKEWQGRKEGREEGKNLHPECVSHHIIPGGMWPLTEKGSSDMF